MRVAILSRACSSTLATLASRPVSTRHRRQAPPHWTRRPRKQHPRMHRPKVTKKATIKPIMRYKRSWAWAISVADSCPLLWIPSSRLISASNSWRISVPTFDLCVSEPGVGVGIIWPLVGGVIIGLGFISALWLGGRLFKLLIGPQ